MQDNSFLEEPGSGRAAAVPDDQKDPHLLYGPVEAQWVLNVLDDTLQFCRGGVYTSCLCPPCTVDSSPAKAADRAERRATSKNREWEGHVSCC